MKLIRKTSRNSKQQFPREIKGAFGCKSVRLNLNWKSGRKNAFLPDLARVCGSMGCTDVCNLKPSDSNMELEAPYLNWRQDLSSDSVYGKVTNFLVTFSVFFGRLEEHQKFCGWFLILRDATERPHQNQNQTNLEPKVATEHTLILVSSVLTSR